MGLLAQSQNIQSSNTESVSGGLLSRNRKQKTEIDLNDPLGTKKLIRGASALQKSKTDIQKMSERNMDDDVISAAPDKKRSLLGALVSKLPNKISKPLLNTGEKIKEFISPPSFSERMKIALEENPDATTQELQERALEIGKNEYQIIGESEKGNDGVTIDPTGAIGSVRSVVSKLVKESSKEVVAKLLRTEFKNASDDIVKNIAPKIAKETTETGVEKQLARLTKQLQKKERGFVTSAKEAVPDAQKIAGQYIPRSTDDLAIKAKNLIADDIQTAERLALEGTDENAVATASELLKHYAARASATTDEATRMALYDKSAEIANTLAPKLTEQGRAIQAASILGRLTPEGQVRFAAKEILRWNELHPKKAIPELNGRQADEIITEMRSINQMADGEEKAIRFKKLQERIMSLVPSTTMEKAIAVWKAGLLTGFKTHGLNIFSNLVHSGLEIAKDVPATGADILLSLITGKRTTTMGVRGLGDGVKEGAKRGWTYLKTGYDTRDVGAKLDYKQVNFKNKAVNAYVNGVFRVLGAEDQVFYYGALKRSIYNQAKVAAKNKGLKGKEASDFIEKLAENPTDEISGYAVADAETAVFQQRTALHEKLGRGIQKLGGGVGEFVAPFSKTPSGVAMQVINYSPVGVVAEVAKQITKKSLDQRTLSKAFGRSTIGAGALWAGKEMYDNSLISLGYPETEKERELWKAEGRKANSIKVGDKWRTVQTLGPAGPVMLMGGYFAKALEESGSPTEAIVQSLGGVASSFTEQTFLKGVNDMISVLTDPQPYKIRGVAASFISSWIPTIINDVARSIDPKERRTATESIPREIFKRIQSRIPLLRQELEPQVDVLGRERERVGNPLEVMLDATRPSPDISTPVTEELRRLFDAGFNVTPTMVGDRSGFEALSDDENTELWKMTGDILNSKLNNLFKNEKYQNLDDEQKSDKVKEFISKAQVIGRAGMAIKLTEGLSGEDLKSKLSELKAGGLLTKNVWEKYKELR